MQTSAARTPTWLVPVTVELSLLLLTDLPRPEGLPVVLKRDVTVMMLLQGRNLWLLHIHPAH